jgi:hypothetical protein
MVNQKKNFGSNYSISKAAIDVSRALTGGIAGASRRADIFAIPRGFLIGAALRR